MGRRSVHDRRYQRVLSQLIEARQASGVSQVRLAKMIRSNQSHVSKLERGERRLDILEFALICSALNLDPTLVLKHIASTER